MPKQATCPQCQAPTAVRDDAELSEILECGECGAELEVLSLDPVTLVVAPPTEEDWGE